MCITESHCCAVELNATLKVSHTSIKILEKKKSVHNSLSPCLFPSGSCSLFSLQRMLGLLLCPHNPYFIKKKKQTLYLVLEYSRLTIF